MLVFEQRANRLLNIIVGHNGIKLLAIVRKSLVPLPVSVAFRNK